MKFHEWQKKNRESFTIVKGYLWGSDPSTWCYQTYNPVKPFNTQRACPVCLEKVDELKYSTLACLSCDAIVHGTTCTKILNTAVPLVTCLICEEGDL